MHQNCETTTMLLKELQTTRCEVIKMTIKLQNVIQLIESLDASYVSLFNIISENIENGILSSDYTQLDNNQSWN